MGKQEAYRKTLKKAYVYGGTAGALSLKEETNRACNFSSIASSVQCDLSFVASVVRKEMGFDNSYQKEALIIDFCQQPCRKRESECPAYPDLSLRGAASVFAKK